jgi:hypothetical protein
VGTGDFFGGISDPLRHEDIVSPPPHRSPAESARLRPRLP